MVVENVGYQNEQNATNEGKEQRKSGADRTNESPSLQEGQKQGKKDLKEDNAMLRRRAMHKSVCNLTMSKNQSAFNCLCDPKVSKYFFFNN